MVTDHHTTIETINVIQQLKRGASAPIPTQDFVYTIPQYHGLIKATLATSAISIVSSFLIISAFIYLRYTAPEKPNRISLRCVFLASIMNLINAIFDIIIIVLYGDTTSCRTSGIISLFTRVLSAAFLAIVGLNLVIVFVFNNSSTPARRLELYYYPCIIVYGCIAIAVPIADTVRNSVDNQDNLRCFYYIYYHQLFGYSSFSWMWFYGWLFFTVVLAVICSCIALTKLMYEHRTLISKFMHIASTSTTAPAPHATVGVDTAEDNAIQQRIKYQSNIFMRVVSRCVAYPMVPLISNIWGFVFQLMLIHPHIDSPKYGLSLTDAIFRCLQGFFVAIVFFRDPAMTHFISDQWKLYKTKYIDDYSRIRRYSNGKIEVLVHSTKLDPLRTRTSSPALITPPSFVNTALSAEGKKSNESAYFKRSGILHEKRRSVDTENNSVYDTMPMRRLSVPPSVYTRLYQQRVQHPFSWDAHDFDGLQGSATSADDDFDEGVTPTLTPDSSRRPSCIPDPQYANQVLVPYKYPRLASAIHRTLIFCGLDSQKRHKRQECQQEGQLKNGDQPFRLRLDENDGTTIELPQAVHPLSRN